MFLFLILKPTEYKTIHCTDTLWFDTLELFFPRGLIFISPEHLRDTPGLFFLLHPKLLKMVNLGSLIKKCRFLGLTPRVAICVEGRNLHFE